MDAPQYLPSNVQPQGAAVPVQTQLPAPLPVIRQAPVAAAPAQSVAVDQPAPIAYAPPQPAYQPPTAQAGYQAPRQVSEAPAAQYRSAQPDYLPVPAPSAEQPPAPIAAAVAATQYSPPQMDYVPSTPPAAYEQASPTLHYQSPVQQEQRQYVPAPAEQTQYQQTQYQQTQYEQTQYEQIQNQPPQHQQSQSAQYQQATPYEQPATAQYQQAEPAQYQQDTHEPATLQLTDQSQLAYQQSEYRQSEYQQAQHQQSAPSMEYLQGSPAQPAPPQQPTAYQQQSAPLASRMDFQPLPSPVVFEPEPEHREIFAADIFQSQPAPVSAPTAIRQPVAPALEMSRDANLRADLDLDAALQQVLDLGASDLHVAVNATPMIRIDGGLRSLDGAQVWGEEKVANALKSILTPEQLEIYETALEFDFAYTLSSQARFRVNFYQQRDNMGAAFRLIPTEIKSLKELGVPDSIAEFAKLPRGLVLITGPTGSGKSTTLAGLIDIVNRTRADHIMTVEDPIEFLHVNHKSLINQREVGHDTHSFGAALKHVLRQDPDVILVGELRDLETISVALTAAETGHLVFATLHTSDAPQTIDRIIDVYPPHQQSQVRAQLAATLQGVVCQTLIKKASGRGRVVATEVLVRTSAVANLIREGKTFQIHSAMQAGRELGMHTIDQHLADLVSTGQITLEAAKEKSHDLQILERLIAGSRAPTTNSSSNMAESMSFGGQN